MIYRPRAQARVLKTVALVTLPVIPWLASCVHRDGTVLSRGEAHFVEEIKPLLEKRCLPCHNGRTLGGRYNLAYRSTAFQAAPAGPFIVPGKPEESKILTVVLLAEKHHQAMPPTGHGLSEVEIALLEEWIRDGASWPEGRSGNLAPPANAEPRSF